MVMKFLENLWNLLVKNRSVFLKITPLKQMASSETFCLKMKIFNFLSESRCLENFPVSLHAFRGVFRNFPSSVDAGKNPSKFSPSIPGISFL